jgi:hypothetical protein
MHMVRMNVLWGKPFYRITVSYHDMTLNNFAS